MHELLTISRQIGDLQARVTALELRNPKMTHAQIIRVVITIAVFLGVLSGKLTLSEAIGLLK